MAHRTHRSISHDTRWGVTRNLRHTATRVGATSLGLATLLALTACAPGGPGAADAGGSGVDGETMSTSQPLARDCAGVSVIVDFGILPGSPVDTCVDISAETAALEVLEVAGVSLVGTADYGDAVVCRVNDLPDETTPIAVEGHDSFTESCASMPPEFAYWALWVKQGSPDWAYAMVGVGDLVVNPGESIGLVFTTGTSTPTPS